MKKLFVFGASGHAKVVIDILERMDGYRIVALIDDDSGLWGKTFFDYPVIGGREMLLDRGMIHDASGIVAIGDNKARMSVADWLRSEGCKLINAVHSHAQIGRRVTLGAGNVVMAGAVINSGTCIGDNVVVNTSASIDHDCILENGVHIAPGCNICGGVSVGQGSLIGAGSTVIPGVHVGNNVQIGAGSTVIGPVCDGAKVVGSPARMLVKCPPL